jgi:hypothetical protein
VGGWEGMGGEDGGRNRVGVEVNPLLGGKEAGRGGKMGSRQGPGTGFWKMLPKKGGV